MKKDPEKRDKEMKNFLTGLLILITSPIWIPLLGLVFIISLPTAVGKSFHTGERAEKFLFFGIFQDKK